MGEWKTYRLGDICQVLNGRAYKQEELLNQGPYPVLRVGNIFQGNNWYYSDLELPDDKYCYNGDLLYAWSCGFAPYIWKGKKSIYHYHIWKLKENPQIIDKLFFYYYLIIHTKYNLGGTHGSVMLHLTKKDFENQTLHLPPLEEQRRIAGILGALDDKIELNRRINANLEAQAQALFRSWFVDNKTNDLKYYELGDIATISAGGDKPAVYSKDLTEQCCIPIYSNGIDNEGLYGYTNSAKINTASITISARGTIGYVCLRTKPYVPIVRLISVVPNESELSAEFLYLWALTQNISGTGTTQQQLTVPDFRKTSIGLPPEETLKRFNNVIIPIFQKIDTNKNENKTLSALRDTLLPKLMAGEIKK